MGKYLLLVILLACAVLPTHAEETPAPRARLVILSDFDDYRAEAQQNPGHRMVDLAQAIPGIAIDLRYATEDNFMHRVLYDSARAWLRAAAARRLAEVEADLKEEGLGLEIWDAYRPFSVTQKMWKTAQPKLWPYLAPPMLGSNHNRGVAVDVTLIDLKTGKELAMPTDFDAFGPKAHRDNTDLPAEAIAHRDLLRRAMERHGFQGYSEEWWHYALHGANDYSVLNLPVSSFEKHSLRPAPAR